MATYRVFSASIYNNQGVVNAKCVSPEPSSVGTKTLVVDGDPTHRVVVTGGRVVEDKTDPSGVRSILMVEPPTFPIEELVGKVLVPYFAADAAPHDPVPDAT